MGRIALVGAALMLGFLALVATAPSNDASAPEWMKAVRSSIPRMTGSPATPK